MTSSRISERWTVIAALFVLITPILLPLSYPANAAVGAEALLPPTPLVLKDGRIANVSIHVLPFGRGDGELAGDAASRLAELTSQVATDCFLTAQVIGHVSSREVAENETLAAHRLARSRADAVQASLIGGGLPAKAIASVWDWQFLVREPRATLWVFRLIQGEDCDGLPLDGSASQLVAGNDVSGQAEPVEAASSPAQAYGPEVKKTPQRADPQPARPAPRVATAEKPAPAPTPAEQAASPLSPVVGSAAAAEAEPTAAITASEMAARTSDDAPAPAESQPQKSGQPAERTAAPVVPAPDALPTVTESLPALSPSQHEDSSVASRDESSDTTAAAVEPPRAAPSERSQRADTAAADKQQSAKQAHPERQGKVEAGQDGNVVITFATNSSYFPPGTTRRLRSLIGSMDSGGRYRVQLQVGVSGSDKVVGATTPEEARRYNKWLAERRMSRVQEWLAENAQDRQLEIEPAFQPDDSSRRVVVRVAPVG